MNNLDKQALIDGSAPVQTQIVIVGKNGQTDITLSDEDSVKSWTYSDMRYIPDHGFIGQFVARTLDGELQNISDDFNIENKEIKLYLGVKRYVENWEYITDETSNHLTTEDHYFLSTEEVLGDYVTTYYSMGTFIVEKPDDDNIQDNTKFISSDYTLRFNADFDGDYTDEEYTKSFNQTLIDVGSVTALWLAKYTCKQANVELATTDFRNNDFIIKSNPFQDGDALRDVMKAIAKLAYSWVRIGWDDKAYLDFNVKTKVEDVYNNITNDNYYTLETQNEKYKPRNKVALGLSNVIGDSITIQDEQSVELYGENILSILDNPLTYNDELRTLAIQKANSMFGLQYDVVGINTTGYPWLQGPELISVSDMENNKLYLYPFDKVVEYNGHITSTIASYSLTDVEEDYDYTGADSVQGERRNAKLELDRANARITALTTSTTNDIAKINEKFPNYATKDSVTSLTEYVETIQDESKLTIGIVKDIQENGVSKVKTTKGFTFDDRGMTVDETNAPTRCTTDTDGVHVVDKTGSQHEDLLFAGYDEQTQQTIVKSENMNVKTYFSVGTHSRFEDYMDGTGVFYIGG